MGRHSKAVRPRVRSAVTAGVVGLSTLGPVGAVSAQAAGDLVEGTPCTITARACVDVDARQAWLVTDGEVVRGPVPMSPGAPGLETPRGDFHVEWKDANHRSSEFNDAPMPFSVFFAPGGIAFHEGNLHTASAGCVRLTYDDARAFFEHLRVGDPVQVR